MSGIRWGMRLVSILVLVAFLGVPVFRFLVRPVTRLITGVSAAAGPYAGSLATGLRALAMCFFLASLWWSVRKIWALSDSSD